MSILTNPKPRLLIQGIMSEEGLFHTQQMMGLKSSIVAGVTPGKGGDWALDGKIPVFDTVKVAVDATGADISVIFLPAMQSADAIFEAIDSEIPLIICITEGIPIQDMMKIKKLLEKNNVRLLGPNSVGILTPGEVKAGIIPAHIAMPGNVGVVSRSGTLTFEILFALKNRGIGISTCVGIGGDPIKGMSFTDILEMFEADPHTKQVILIGEIGGNDEEEAAEYIAGHMTKPVIAYIAGQTAPSGKRMGHAGAIIERGLGAAQRKITALQNSRVRVANHTEEIYGLIIN
jgi:succinyl-CoA synthetase alpha subunit